MSERGERRDETNPAAAAERRRVPPAARLAALALVGAAVARAADAASRAGAPGAWGDAAPGAAIALVGSLAVAWGIWRGHRWGWRLGVLVGLYALVGFCIALFLASRLSGDRPSMPTAAPGAVVFAALSALGVALLLLPRSRTHFAG